jgi:hypothetical protein
MLLPLCFFANSHVISLFQRFHLRLSVWFAAGRDPALGHPIEYICLDGDHPAVCKYCGLRYSLQDAHGHH